MSKFLIELPKSKASAVIEYDENGFLIDLKLTVADMSDEQKRYFNAKLPKRLDLLQIWKESFPTMKVKEIELDLSFQTFWDLYANKVGNKEKAVKTWEKMPETEKAKALKWLPTYETQIAISKVAKMYPETFLNQKRWNN